MFLMSRPKGYNTSVNAARPKVNVLENDEQFKLFMMIPGFSQDDLNITIEGDTLTIESTKELDGVTTGKWNQKQFQLQNFKRSFSLPKSVETDRIEASVKNGLLELTLGKRAKQVIAIA